MSAIRNFIRRPRKTDAYRNVIVFSDPHGGEHRAHVTKLVVESVGGSLSDAASTTTSSSTVSIPDPSLDDVFDTIKHLTAPYRCIVYETVGLTESTKVVVEPHKALGNLHRFTSALSGEVDLLVYVVPSKPSRKNYLLFYEYLCQEATPIILVRTDPGPDPAPVERDYQFEQILDLGPDTTTLKIALRDAIKRQSTSRARAIASLDRFEQTAMKSWNLLEKEARWDLRVCRDALMETLVTHGLFSQESALAKRNEITDYIEKHYFHNVIVFGETGAGKTSVVEMLLNGRLQIREDTASSIERSTERMQSYKVDIQYRNYLVHDTIGLDDVKDSKQAIKELYQLISRVEGGVSLLVYVHKDRIKSSKVRDYQIFHDGVCEGKVPTVLVQTGLEHVENIDDWWSKNEPAFKKLGIKTEHHACITTTKGAKDVYLDKFNEGAHQLRKVIYDATLPVPWKPSDTTKWLTKFLIQVVNNFAETLGGEIVPLNASLYQALSKVFPDEAKKITNLLEAGAPLPKLKPL